MLICCGCDKARLSRNDRPIGSWISGDKLPDIPETEYHYTFCPDCYRDFQLVVESDLQPRGAALDYGNEFLRHHD